MIENVFPFLGTDYCYGILFKAMLLLPDFELASEYIDKVISAEEIVLAVAREYFNSAVKPNDAVGKLPKKKTHKS